LTAALDWDVLRRRMLAVLGEGGAFALVVQAGEDHTDTAMLSEDECARAHRLLRPRDRGNFILGRTLVRRLLIGDGPRAHEPLASGATGKPFVPGHEFNLSYSGNRLALAVCGRGPVGIDLEAQRPADALAEFIAHDSEMPFLAAAGTCARGHALRRLWCRKEALLKATGRGLAHPMNAIDTGLEATCAVRLDGRAWRVAELVDEPDHCLCIATTTEVAHVELVAMG
jgi:4'-phosphopantetheinyl transferase